MSKVLQGKKILFANIPSDGHFNPLTGLAKYLQEAGNDVRWYTSNLFKDKLVRLGIPHYPFNRALDANSANLDSVFPERTSIQDPIEKLNFDMINVFTDRSPEFYADLLDIQESFPFELVIADSFFSAIPFVRAKMDIPVVAVGVAPLAADSVDLPPYGMGMVPATDDAQRAEHANLREFARNVLFKPSIDSYDATLREYGITAAKTVPFDLLIKESDLLLQIGTPGFEYPRTDLGSNVRFVGALLPYAAAAARAPWYDERVTQYKKIVLVTQGTAEKDIQKILVPTLEAFKGSDTLVIAATGGGGTEELRAHYAAPNVIIEDYISFAEVMPYASVYVTNGGYGGVLLSIQNKLPLVTAGVHEGKNEICTRVGYFQLGVDLNTETPTPEAIREAVEKVLSDPNYKDQVVTLSAELSQYDTLELCANYIAELLRETAAAAIY